MTIKTMDSETLDILDFVWNFDKDTLYCDKSNEVFKLYEGVLSPTLEELIKYETLLYSLNVEFWVLFNSEAEVQQLKNTEDLTIYRNALYLLEELIKRTEAMKKIKKELKKYFVNKKQ